MRVLTNLVLEGFGLAVHVVATTWRRVRHRFEYQSNVYEVDSNAFFCAKAVEEMSRPTTPVYPDAGREVNRRRKRLQQLREANNRPSRVLSFKRKKRSEEEET